MRSPYSYRFSHARRSKKSGFSLLEILVVLMIMSLMAAAVAPAISYLTTGNIDSVSIKAQGALEEARQYAQTHATYVRVGFAEFTANGATNIAVQCINSTSGDLRSDDTVGMNNEDNWRAIGRAVILEKVNLDESLLSLLPESVDKPGTHFTQFSRKGPGGQTITYKYIFQFDPSGRANVESTVPARFVGVGLSNPRQPKNPVVILLSGLTGQVRAIRQENLNR